MNENETIRPEDLEPKSDKTTSENGPRDEEMKSATQSDARRAEERRKGAKNGADDAVGAKGAAVTEKRSAEDAQAGKEEAAPKRAASAGNSEGSERVERAGRGDEGEALKSAGESKPGAGERPADRTRERQPRRRDGERSRNAADGREARLRDHGSEEAAAAEADSAARKAAAGSAAESEAGSVKEAEAGASATAQGRRGAEQAARTRSEKERPARHAGTSEASVAADDSAKAGVNREAGEPREKESGRESKEDRQERASREGENSRRFQDGRDPKVNREPKAGRDAQENRDPKENREGRSDRESRNGGESRGARENRNGGENQSTRESRNDRVGQQDQNSREARNNGRSPRNGKAAKSGPEGRRRSASSEGRAYTSREERAPSGSFAAWLAEMRTFLRGRFSLEEDKAQSDEVVANISRGVEFRGMNLWVLIFATMIASLGLNVNSAAVIIGAMLVSPIMGPIMGVGLALGINDFDLFKRSVRNLVLMFSVAIVTSTLYFLVSPLSANSSELLARTVPTTYDVLIALFGGLAGIVAQSCKDRNTTVIPGVAIATALIPPLCTAGFGLATGQWRFFLGAFYLFFINSVFIALATFAMVRFLHYEKRVFLDKRRERNVRRWMMTIALVTFIPSVVIGLRMVRVSLFEAAVDRYVAQVFDFPQTRVVESARSYAWRDQPSRIELLLLGEPLGEEVIDNARGQLRNFGLEKAELIVRQANRSDEVDVNTLQRSYLELLEEKNRRIVEMNARLERYCMPDVEVEDVSREAGMLIGNIGRLSLAKSILYDTEGTPCDTLLVCTVERRDSTAALDRATLEQWLRLRTKSPRVKLVVE